MLELFGSNIFLEVANESWVWISWGRWYRALNYDQTLVFVNTELMKGEKKEAVIMIRLEANNGSLKTVEKRWLMGKTGLRSSQVELREGAWLSRSSLTLTFTKCSALMDLAPEGSPQNHFCKVLLIYSSQWTFSVRLKLCVISVLWPIEVLVKGP